MIATIFSRWMKKTFPKARGRALARRAKAGVKPKPSFKPMLETFEDRVVPATHTVITNVDSVATFGSLPYWLANSNAGDTINFQSGVNDIILSAGLTVSKSVTITDAPNLALGQGPLVISGANNYVVFTVDPGVTASFSGLYITAAAGTVNGGGIYNNDGNVTVTNTTFAQDGAINGGAILNNNGTLYVYDSTFVDNDASIGAAIENSGFAYVVSSTFSGNVATSSGGGVWNVGNILIGDSTFVGNSAVTTGDGGGVYTAPTGNSTQLYNDILVGNTDGSGANTAEDDVAGKAVSGSGWNLLVAGGDLTGSVTYTSVATPAAADLTPLGWYGGPTETYALLPDSPAIGIGNSGGYADQRGQALQNDIGAFQYNPLVVNTSLDAEAVPYGSLALRNAVNLVDVDTVVADPEPISFSTLPATTTTTDFSTAQTISLAVGTLTLGGASPIAPVTITGPAAGVTVSGGGATGVFHVDSGVKASIKGASTGAFTITDGFANKGGGIYNAGDLTIKWANLSDNVATASFFDGGGIGNFNGTVSASHVQLSSNSATGGGGQGGGILSYGGKLSIAYGDFSDNTASLGGAVTVNVGGTANVSYSTFTGNVATLSGGGIVLLDGGSANIFGSTFTSNESLGSFYPAGGGGIFGLTGNKLSLIDSTLVDNTAVSGGGGVGISAGTLSATDDTITGNSSSTPGGGLYTTGTTLLNGDIIAANTGTGGAAADIGGAAFNSSSSFNLVGVDNTGTLVVAQPDANGNYVSATYDTGAAGLAALGWYGGPTETVALLPGSPAIAHGLTPGTNTTINVDQRGVTRTNAVQGDIGAFQTQTVGGTTGVLVNTIKDGPLSTPEPLGIISLRDAVNIVDNNTSAITEPIGFDPTVFPAQGPIVLDPTVGTLVLGPAPIAPVLIEGPAGGVTISGGGMVTVFQVEPGVSAEFRGNATADLNITGGAGASGGGIANTSGAVSARYVTFSGNSATNGGGIFNSGGSVSLHDSTFSDNSATNDGGAIFSDAPATVTVHSGTSFDNNTAGNDGGAIYSIGTLTVYGSHSSETSFLSNSATAAGGAIYSDGTTTLHGYGFGNVAIGFTDNKAGTNGGAIWSLGGLFLDGAGSTNAITFTGNTALNGDGGAIDNSATVAGTIEDATFSGNKASTGGGIYTTGAMLEILDSKLVNNEAIDGDGGGLYDAGKLKVYTDTDFTSNIAVKSGGGLAVVSGSATISDGIFTKNVAVDGGGLFVSGGGTVSVPFAEFNENVASGNGAGMAVEGTGTTTVEAFFFSNTADVNGGGFYNTQTAPVTLTTSLFSGNIAKVDGGGVYNIGTLTIQNSDFFSANTATNGGGVYNASGLTIHNVNIDDSIAKTDGAGVYNSGNLAVTTATFAGNAAGDKGGGLYTTGGGSVTLTPAIFDNNSAVNSGGGIFDGNTNTITIGSGTFAGNGATKGGGIYAASGTLKVDPTTFTANKATDGAAIYNAAATVTLTGDTLKNNTATVDGGGVFNAATVVADGDGFTSNSAGSEGGGMYNATGAVATVATGAFVKNTAGSNGGGIFNLGGTLNITATAFTGNKATFGDGGGVFNGNALTIDSASTFTDNGAGFDGGGIYNTGSMTVTGSTPFFFSGNTAGFDGGGLYDTGTVAGDQDYSFDGNKAGFEGGGAYFFDATANFKFSLFSNNTAGFDGGGLFFAAGNGDTASLIATDFDNNQAKLGGGVYNSGSMSIGATITPTFGVTDTSDFIGNTALEGGGLFNNAGIVKVTESSFTDNSVKTSAEFGGKGGGIYNSGGLFLTASTLNGNTASTTGGGGTAEGGGLAAISTSFNLLANDTFYANSAADTGGGIFNSGGLSATDNTLFKNSAGSFLGGGGLYTLGSTILNGDLIVGNTDPFFPDDVSGNSGDINVSGSNNNLVGTDWTGALKNNVDNQVDVPAQYWGVEDLAYNGGPVETCSLQVGSYALGKGLVPTQVYATNASPTLDARGVPRPGEENLNPNDDGLAGSVLENGDVGAFQFSNPPQVTTQPVSEVVSLPAPTLSPPTVVSPLVFASFSSSVTDIYNDWTPPPSNDSTSVPSTVQWQISTDGGVSWTNITPSMPNSGMYGTTPTTTTLSINGPGTGEDATYAQLEALNGDEFRAVFTNTAGETTTTNAASLTVNYAPFVTTNPTNVTIVEGDTATFSASDISSPTATVQWYYEAPGGSFTSLSNGSFLSGAATISGSTTDTLTIATDPTLGLNLNGYQFEAVFTNGLGSVTTSAATLDVEFEPQGIVNPQNTTVVYTGTPVTASFSTSYSSANPPASVSWLVSTNGGGTFVPVAGGNYSITAGVDESTLMIGGVTPALNGYMYEAVYTNAAGTVTTTAATLTVDYPATVSVNPLPVTIVEGNNATFTAADNPVGNPAVTVQWQISTNGGGTWTNLTNSGVYSGVATDTLTITAAPSSLNQDEYRAVFSNTLQAVNPNGSAIPEAVDTTGALLTVNFAPIVATAPANTTVNAGPTSTATFTATWTPGYNSAINSAPGTTTVQWLVSTNGGASFSLVQGSIYSVAPATSTTTGTTTTLTITGLTASMNGYEYEAVLSNGISPNAIAGPATLTVDFPPAIIASPVDETVQVGNTATFTATASNNPASTVVWEVSTDGGATFNPVSGAEYSVNTSSAGTTTTTTLTITDTPVSLNADEYEAVFTNTLVGGLQGTATAGPATLTVDESPIITQQPTGATFSVGGTPTTVTFSAAATGSPTQPTIQWYVSSDGGNSFSVIQNGTLYSGATSDTLTITEPTAGMNGYEYRAVFDNGIAPPATTVAATLTVDYAPTITANPSNTTVTAGGTATFSAAADGNPTPTVQWEVSTNGGTSFTALTNGTSGGVTYSGVTTDTLTISGVTAALNSDEFEAVFSNTLFGEASASTATTTAATLTVDESPVITQQPTSTTVNAGTPATFTAAATGSPTQPTVQWYVSIDGGNTFSVIQNGTVYSGATTDTLTISDPTAGMNGYVYHAIFSNGIAPPATTNNATLTVDYNPTVTTQPVNTTVDAGQTATFTAAASGNPTPTIQWEVSTNGGATFTNIAGATSTTLTIANASLTMNGNEYEAVFTNSVGSVTTNAATLTVDVAPTITQSPTSEIILVGGSASFTAAATGNPAPTAVWEVSTDGGQTFTPLVIAGAYTVNSSTTGMSTTVTLTITNATLNMSGYEYEAVFSNGVSPPATTTAATLTVGIVPAITLQPNNVVTNVGGTATFTAAASGSPTPTVQWFVSTNGGTSFTAVVNGTVGGVTYSGATTGTLTITGVTTALNGSEYKATFTNVVGSITTNDATLNTLGLVTTVGDNVLVYSTANALVETLTPTFPGATPTSIQAAVGTVLGDGGDDLVVAANGWVQVYHGITASSATLAEKFQPYGASYTSGLNIALGNVLSSNAASVDIVTAPQVPGERVDVFTPTGAFAASFAPFNGLYPMGTYKGGVHIAVGHFFSTDEEAVAISTAAPEPAAVQAWAYFNTSFVKKTPNNFSVVGKGAYVSAVPTGSGLDDVAIGTQNPGSYSSRVVVVNPRAASTAPAVAKLAPAFGAGDTQEVRLGLMDLTGSGTPTLVIATGPGSTQEVLTYTLTSNSLTLEQTLSSTELGLAAGYNGGIYVG